MEISKKVVLESNLSEIEENDISEVLTRFVALNPEKHISQSIPIIDNILSSFEIEKYQIEFKNMSCGPKVVIEESKREVDDKERGVVLNEDNIPIWKGFEEISEAKAISLFKSGEIVFVIDYKGQEARIKDESYFNSSHAYAIERNFQDDDN